MCLKLKKLRALTPLFLKANYCGDSLIEFSKRLLGYLEESALSEFYERMFKGFFTNYLFMSINQNSDNQFLFDEILAVSLLAKDSVDNNHIIQAMAELGHKLSMTALANISRCFVSFFISLFRQCSSLHG